MNHPLPNSNCIPHFQESNEYEYPKISKYQILSIIIKNQIDFFVFSIIRKPYNTLQFSGFFKVFVLVVYQRTKTKLPSSTL